MSQAILRSGASRSDFARIERAIYYLIQSSHSRPDLARVAREAGLSEAHFHRLFSRWAGVTPKQFLEAIAAKAAKARLQDSESILSAALASGLSGPGRLHDLLVTLEGMTPGEYKERGRGVSVRYGVHDTVYGSMLIGLTERGVCHLSFFSGGDRSARTEILGTLPECKPVLDARATRRALVDADLVAVSGCGRRSTSKSSRSKTARLRIHARGTSFQLKVWQALLSVPEGCAVSYRQLARVIGTPSSARAVGNAVASNPVALLIPCHRVIRESGVLHSYRWGEERKKLLLGREWAGT
jgi:AraC family transcriptional regulator of adaptative response/methylated-DNA-[protein]-cysteine methyltransferase